ncbi:MAG: DsbC family protein [Syntrophaceae bacterium]|nr:DsbC family protein [Syntrophaceae bacterium]
MKKLLLTVLFFLLVLPTLVTAQKLSPKEAFRKSFPKHNFESITPSPVKGIYEVYTGNQIYYFLPKEEVIITGNIITKDGVNLTQESNSKKMAIKMAKLPLENAIKKGRGKTEIIEFTDPNCPYCRKAALYFAQRKDVTSYIFLIPLSQDSERKIKHILCSKDKSKTYEDVMSGKLDNNAPLNLCGDSKIEEKIKLYRELASQSGIRATPTFFLKGKVVTGFDINTMENHLTQ